MPTKYRIAKDKDIALKEHDEIVKNSKLFIVYTDDSAINGKVKAAAVVLNLGIREKPLGRKRHQSYDLCSRTAWSDVNYLHSLATLRA